MIHQLFTFENETEHKHSQTLILLKLVENMCLQSQIGIYLRIESKKRN